MHHGSGSRVACAGVSFFAREAGGVLKVILEFVVAIVLHPVAVFLMVLNLLGRNDLSDAKKAVWALCGLLWGIGPILYILLADGALW